MIAPSLGSYLPLSDLIKIVAATLTVAIVAPSAVSLAVIGVDRRAAGSARLGVALIGIGVCVLVFLVAAGL